MSSSNFDPRGWGINHPFGDPREWKAETLDNRLADLNFYSSILTAEDYYRLGIDSQTEGNLSDAVEAALRGINLNRR